MPQDGRYPPSVVVDRGAPGRDERVIALRKLRVVLIVSGVIGPRIDVTIGNANQSDMSSVLCRRQIVLTY